MIDTNKIIFKKEEDIIYDFTKENKSPEESIYEFISNYLSIIKISADICEYDFKGDLFQALINNDIYLTYVGSSNEDFDCIIEWFCAVGHKKLFSIGDFDEIVSPNADKDRFNSLFDYVMINFKTVFKERNFYWLLNSFCTSINYVIEIFEKYKNENKLEKEC